MPKGCPSFTVGVHGKTKGSKTLWAAPRVAAVGSAGCRTRSRLRDKPVSCAQQTPGLEAGG